MRSALLWNAMNLAAGRLKAGAPARYLRIRYEDLVARPGALLQTILSQVSDTLKPLSFLADGKATLDVVHGFSGNPSRFDRGVVHLRPDNEWHKSLKAAPRLLVTALTAPFLARYGYPLLPNAHDEARQFGSSRARGTLRADP